MMIDDLVLKNPVLVKHLRSRLRPQHLIPLVLMVVAICACITWASMAAEEPRGGMMGLITFQGLLLFLVGSSAVAAAVSTARESGMLDFHRISPQRPLALTLGFLLGAPVREFILFACTLPFALVLAAQADHALLLWLAATVDLLLLSPLYYSIAILAGLALPKRTSSTTLTLMLIIFLHMGWMVQAVGCLTIIPLTAALATDAANSAPPIHTTILGFPAPALLVCLLHQLPILAFLLVAITRKMRHELAYPLTKLDAISFYFVMALLLLSDAPAGLAMAGPSHGGESPELGGIALSYGLALLGCLFAGLVTPDAGAFARAVRHARKLGFSHPSHWEERAANPATVAVFAAVFLVAGLVASTLLPGPHAQGVRILAGAFVGACAVLFCGLAKQTFDLMFGKNSNSYFLLLLFGCWALPLIIALSLSVVSTGDDVMVSIIMALSPIAGIGLVIAGDATYSVAVGYAAVIASALLAITFAAFAARAVRRATEAATVVS
jgi:hypothetical protein